MSALPTIRNAGIGQQPPTFISISLNRIEMQALQHVHLDQETQHYSSEPDSLLLLSNFPIADGFHIISSLG